MTAGNVPEAAFEAAAGAVQLEFDRINAGADHGATDVAEAALLAALPYLRVVKEVPVVSAGDVWADAHDADWDAYARRLAAQTRTNTAVARNLKETDR